MDNRKTRAKARKITKVRAHIKKLRMPRLSVNRTSKHIYAQIVSAENGNILASASTLDKDFAEKIGGNINAATVVGRLVAKRALEAGVVKVAFDRGGCKYHGRVKALADAARDGGLDF